jgi:hypothetical protein
MEVPQRKEHLSPMLTGLATVFSGSGIWLSTSPDFGAIVLHPSRRA